MTARRIESRRRERPACPHACIDCPTCASSEWWQETLALRAEVERLRAALESIAGEYGDVPDEQMFDAASNQDFGDHLRFVMRTIETARKALK